MAARREAEEIFEVRWLDQHDKHDIMRVWGRGALCCGDWAVVTFTRPWLSSTPLRELCARAAIGHVAGAEYARPVTSTTCM
jgi:hypothetical protein